MLRRPIESAARSGHNPTRCLITASTWIGTYNAGINRIVGKEIKPITTEHGLSNNAVLSLYEDEDGVVWVGTYGGGLNRIEGNEITVYTTKEGLFNDNVVQILEDGNGYLWISCNRGLFRLNKRELNEFARGETEKIHSIVSTQMYKLILFQIQIFLY